LAIAAIDAHNLAVPFTTSNGVETFSSNGPRKMFFLANGTAITPGNFLAAGGSSRNKPDFAAADGVMTTVPGFQPFYGTSAAAPHAAAITALLLQQNPLLATSSLKTLLAATSLDIMTAGWDIDSGYGTIMALAAATKIAGDSYTSLSLAKSSVAAGLSTEATIHLAVPAPPSGLTFSITASPSVSVPSTVTVTSGQSTANFTVTALTANSDATITATMDLSGVAHDASLHTKKPVPTGLSFSVPRVASGGTCTGTVTLSAAATGAGITVSLSTSFPEIGIPATVVVPNGATSADFTVNAGSVAAKLKGKVYANANSATVTGSLIVLPVQITGISFSPSNVKGGSTCTATVTLSAAAPAGGLTVDLMSDNPGVASVPATLTIAGNQPSGSATVTTSTVAAQTYVKITASKSGNGLKYAKLKVRP
jgi:hypothetical protein